jgi:hypothetical protein
MKISDMKTNFRICSWGLNWNYRVYFQAESAKSAKAKALANIKFRDANAIANTWPQQHECYHHGDGQLYAPFSYYF